ncbi:MULTISPECIES: HU family DNA-binding protein [Segatella]|uniref:HU family DNA-binding protein n=1 Tax=Segatella bryantii TaxID=77095 RepID=A0ABX4EGN7_SEGBR|nr:MULTISPECIES: HU family DNA-binding protein [Segatella]MBQ3858307.1 HU family DNA-binding protein [Prevotella sp.]MDR4931444.1 HU family DNA-binding protein [Segatella bryantii]OYP54716.1 HU family DNA-binding protein [Segatella bryantii]UKK73575.1 HU family DNA-binding protein [Segatella bryantii]UKK77066.1 HU family DNA-binding protein [Segatella bryantii]
MNNKEFITELAQRSGYNQRDTQKLVRTVIDEMTDHFAETDIVSIPSFGTFEVKKRLERIVVNPATKKRMLVPPKLVLGFKPVQSIKEQLKNASFEDEEGGLDE